MEQSESQPPKLTVLQTIKKVFTNLTVEPLVVCWILPFLITYAATENMNLEKGCRELVTDQTGFTKDACKLFVRKDEYDIDCASSEESRFSNVQNDEIKKRFPVLFASIENNLTAVYSFLCDVEEPVQKKLSRINSIRNPISSIGPLIIILFAGPWSDKKNLRVPCMLVPFLGEAIGFLSLFIAAIFINGPVEFPAYAYRLIPSLTGAENLMMMGIFSYLSASSTEEDRTFRFGVFQMLMTIVPIVAQSISPTLITIFDYTQLFGFMIPVHIIGFLYAVFFLKEVKPKADEKEDAAYDNPAMEMDGQNGNHAEISQVNHSHEPQKQIPEKKNACREFFDPELATHCIRSFLKKREYGLRNIIVLFMLMHFLMNGITQGELQNLFLYARAKLSWDVSTYVYHNVFTTVMGLIGTTFAVGVLSKWLQIADIFLILLSTTLSLICRIIYFSATNTIMFFAGTAVDFTFSVKLLCVRSIISKIVPNNDIATMYAIMGLFEALAGFVFPYVYPTLYQYLLDSSSHNISELYLLSAALFSIAIIVYTIIWRLLKKKELAEQRDAANKEKNDRKSMEITKL